MALCCPERESIHFQMINMLFLVWLMCLLPISSLITDLYHSSPNHWASTNSSPPPHLEDIALPGSPSLLDTPFTIQHCSSHPAHHQASLVMWMRTFNFSVHSSNSTSLKASPDLLSLREVHCLCPQGSQSSLKWHHCKLLKLYFNCLFTYSSPLPRGRHCVLVSIT